MNALESLLHVPAAWQSVWQLDATGELRYVEPRPARIPASLLDLLRRAAPAKSAKAPPRDGAPAPATPTEQAPAATAAAPVSAAVEATSAASAVAEPSHDTPAGEAEEPEASDALDSEQPHDESGGHGHHKKKDIREMSGAELTNIAGNCNLKVANYILRRGNEQALMKLLSNGAIEADHVVKIIEDRSPSSTLLSAVGRMPRFNRDKQVAAALCLNVKTPLHIARTMVKRVLPHTLKEISRAAGLPQALKVSAKRLLEKKDK